MTSGLATSGSATTVPTPPPPPILVFGDSLTFSAASYLEEDANAAGRAIEIFARPGAALCDWMPDVEERLPAGPASAVVLVFAGNDNTGCVNGLAGPELIARYERDARRVVGARPSARNSGRARRSTGDERATVA